MEGKKPVHYVDNKKFSEAVLQYVTEANVAKANDQPVPVVPDYIADCFVRIARGLANKSNFVGYTSSYKEEMVMDAVENCLKAINNFDIDKPTRTGKPNAFSYFTQITYFAFLRRIAKENKQNNIKMKIIEQSGLNEFIEESEEQPNTNLAFVDDLKNKVEKSRIRDEVLKDFEREAERNS